MILLTSVIYLFYCINAFETPRGVPIENGSKTLPFIHVNDDYCDCLDGSDEPGTAACRNGQFYCKNDEYIGNYIPSSFVNDGICDCCDGSDEYAPYSKPCNNTCNAKLLELKSKRKKLEELYSAGHKIYKEYLPQIPGKIKSKEEKERMERESKRIAELKRIAEEKEKAEELKRQEEAKRLEEEAKQEDENDASNVGDSEDATSSDYDPAKEAERQILKEEESKSNEEPTTNPDENKEEHEEPADEDIVDQVESEPEEPIIDYGPRDAYFMLTEIPSGCVEMDDNEYTYRFCPFKSCLQISKGSGSEVSLGTWGRWLKRDDEDGKPAIMEYDNGQGCWQGPNRSTKVHIHCGPENTLTSASEPSRCEYEFHFTTPAACPRPAQDMIRLHHSHDEL